MSLRGMKTVSDSTSDNCINVLQNNKEHHPTAPQPDTNHFLDKRLKRDFAKAFQTELELLKTISSSIPIKKY